MKNFILCFFLIFCSITIVQSQTVTWTNGNSTGIWSDPANWSSGNVPLSSDNVRFNGTSVSNCTIDMVPIVKSFSMNSTYSGIVSFDGSNSNMIVGGNFRISGGTFSSTTNNLFVINTLSGSSIQMFRSGSGVFIDNGGIVNLNGTGNTTITISGTFTFSTLRLDEYDVFTPGQRQFEFGTNAVTSILNIGGSYPFGFGGSIKITSLFANSNNNNTFPSNNTGTFVCNSAANPFSLTGPVTAGRGKLANITFSMGGVPALSGNISIVGTWNNIRCGNITAGTSTVNFYGANCAIVTHTAAPTNAARRAKFHNLKIQSGATVAMGDRNFALIRNNFVNDGTLNATSKSILGFNGTGTTAQSLGGTAIKTTIGALYFTSSNRNINMGHSVDVLDSIKFRGINGKFNTNGHALTLKATNTLKARVSEIRGGGNAGIVGNVTVETFAKGNITGWTNMGIAGVNGNVVSNWDGQFPMTCNGCVNATTSIPGGFASFVAYNEPGNGGAEYVTASSTDALTPGKGWWVYLGTGQFSTTDLTFVNVGTTVQGSVSVGLTNTPASAYPGQNLVSNPYSAPIKFRKLRNSVGVNSTQIGDTYSIFNPDIGPSGTTSLFNATSGLTTPAGSGAKDTIPAGQGFFVDCLGASSTLVFAEFAKIGGPSNSVLNPLLKSANSSTIDTEDPDAILDPNDTIDILDPVLVSDTYDVGDYFRLQLTGFNGDVDDAIIHFHPNSNQGFDPYDARKIFQSPGYVGYPGPYTKYTTISTRMGIEDYAINSLMPSSSLGYNIPVLVRVMQTGNYAIAPIDLNYFPSSVCITLHDKLLNVNHDLRTGAYNCNISDTTSAPRFELIVCAMPITTSINNKSKSAASSIAINKDDQGIFVDFDFAKATNAKIMVTNVLGQKIMDAKKVKVTSDNVYLDINTDDQLIFVTVETETEKVTKKFLNFR